VSPSAASPPERDSADSADDDVTVIAFHLPQFYPIPENDQWWEPGFTEWTNVARARPLYPGHRQPNLPGELGFYDLRLPETRAAQAALAQAYGVSAFCYWHYWFAGRRILERVVDEVVASGEPDLPFCLAWANPSWIGSWFGAPDEVLIEQRYPGDDDHRAHFEDLLPALTDPRYLRVDGRPLLYVEAPAEIPDPRRFTDLWRELACQAGLPGLFLVGRRRGESHQWHPRDHGFDAATNWLLQPAARRLVADGHRTWDWWLTAATRRIPWLPTILFDRTWSPHIAVTTDDDALDFPCVMPNWDNTPRARRDGVVFHGARPERFRRQVADAVRLLDDRPAEHRILFVKSWNEWAEGNHLEPDRRFGRAWLEALRDGVLDGRRTLADHP
jgi:lipopolysaccharide biosynthesis protein